MTADVNTFESEEHGFMLQHHADWRTFRVDSFKICSREADEPFPAGIDIHVYKTSGDVEKEFNSRLNSEREALKELVADDKKYTNQNYTAFVGKEERQKFGIVDGILFSDILAANGRRAYFWLMNKERNKIIIFKVLARIDHEKGYYAAVNELKFMLSTFKWR